VVVAAVRQRLVVEEGEVTVVGVEARVLVAVAIFVLDDD